MCVAPLDTYNQLQSEKEVLAMNIKWKTTMEISGLLIVIIVITNIFINISVSGLLNEENRVN
jgi:hypothetical protein